MADTLIFAEMLLPQGEALNINKVIYQEIDKNGKFIGSHDKNPLMNTLAYDMEFSDNSVKSYGFNIIAENILPPYHPDIFYMNDIEVIIYFKRDGSSISNYGN